MKANTHATPRDIPEKWAWHHRALSRIRDTLLRERAEREAAARTSLERGGADMVDVANDQAEHETLMAELAQERTELAEVEAALDRIRRGAYGICEATGLPISAERLRAVPWTRLSMPAARRREGAA